MNDDKAAAFSLLNAAAVRTRAKRMLALGLDDKLPNFRVDLARLDHAVDLVIAATRRDYPSLDIPFHSRWRHFVVDGASRAGALADFGHLPDRAATARAAFDLVIVSVLLDAGAGPQWRYRDPLTGKYFARSEGLALASLDMFGQGSFSSDPTNSPHRVDGTALAELKTATLSQGFQVKPHNPLLGLEGRAQLLRSLGKLVLARPEIFGRNDTPRPGGFFDHLAAKAEAGAISAPLILSELLQQFGPIWPSRLTLGGVPLGDCWRHPAMITDDPTSELVPLHKLSQWLAYSLIEPLQQAGFTVTDIDGLTGLAEYRNGGLFVDTGVLVLRDATPAARAYEVDSALVVEWRALTVALLDRLALAVRAKLNKNAAALPLAKILQGGTWTAGRELAFARRVDGSPPIKVTSDGTVF
ncbi:MAG TPA: URC4/urg3 family protein [Xanthobacteraceae bacterium]|nr:URC4/urg3 family protein [Xanthobacteraceae bacterium]